MAKERNWKNEDYDEALKKLQRRFIVGMSLLGVVFIVTLLLGAWIVFEWYYS